MSLWVCHVLFCFCWHLNLILLPAQMYWTSSSIYFFCAWQKWNSVQTPKALLGAFAAFFVTNLWKNWTKRLAIAWIAFIISLTQRLPFAFLLRWSSTSCAAALAGSTSTTTTTRERCWAWTTSSATSATSTNRDSKILSSPLLSWGAGRRGALAVFVWGLQLGKWVNWALTEGCSQEEPHERLFIVVLSIGQQVKFHYYQLAKLYSLINFTPPTTLDPFLYLQARFVTVCSSENNETHLVSLLYYLVF